MKPRENSSPKYPAGKFKLGTIKKGRDGKMYKVVKNWVRPPSKHPMSNMFVPYKTARSCPPDQNGIKPRVVYKNTFQNCDDYPRMVKCMSGRTIEALRRSFNNLDYTKDQIAVQHIWIICYLYSMYVNCKEETYNLPRKKAILEVEARWKATYLTDVKDYYEDRFGRERADKYLKEDKKEIERVFRTVLYAVRKLFGQGECTVRVNATPIGRSSDPSSVKKSKCITNTSVKKSKGITKSSSRSRSSVNKAKKPAPKSQKEVNDLNIDPELWKLINE